MIKRFKFLIFIVMIITTFAGCKKTETITYISGYPDLKGKHIVVYVASREDVGKMLLESFKEKTGCTYEYLRLPTEEGVLKVKEEKKNPKADVFIGGTCDAHEIMKNEGLSEKYISVNSNDIPEEYKDNNGYWTGFEIEPLSIVINKERWDREFKPKGIELPKSVDDLLKPEFKGEIVIPSPVTSGTGYTLMASIYQSMGDEKVKAYIDSLRKNIGGLTLNGFNPVQKVTAGEYLIGVNFLGDQLLMKESGANILSIVPEKAGWNINAVSKIRNSPNSKVAELFIDFCLSKETTKTMEKFSKGIPTRSSTTLDVPILKNYNFYLASKNRSQILSIWK